MEVLEWFGDNYAAITAIVVAAVGLARLIVMVTPTKADDDFVAKIVALLKVVGLHVKDKPNGNGNGDGNGGA